MLVGIYNQQFQGTIFLMVFDFQGNVDFMAGHPPHPTIHPQEIRLYYNLIISGKGKTLQGGVGWKSPEW